MFALLYQESRIILLGPEGDLFKRIDIDFLTDVQWSPDGCHLRIATHGPKGVFLHSVNLVSGMEQKLWEGHTTRDNWSDYPRASPDGKWVAYLMGSSKDDPQDVTLRDVQVVAVDAPDRPVSLTTRGGAGYLGGVWSPDGRRVAYSDYDDAGNGQMYLARPDGSDRRQLTHFETPRTTMNRITWSPDGQKLAFTVYDDQEGNMYGIGNQLAIWVVHADGSGLREMTLDDGSSVKATPLWWGLDSQVLVAYARGDDSVQGLYWFDTDTGRAIHVFYDSEAPLKTIVAPFAISSTQTIGFKGGDLNFYTYDLADRSYKLWLDTTVLFPKPYSQGLLLKVIPLPGGPVDTRSCPVD